MTTTSTPARARRQLPAVGSQLFLLLLTLGFLAPVAWAILSAFKPAIEIILCTLVALVGQSCEFRGMSIGFAMRSILYVFWSISRHKDR